MSEKNRLKVAIIGAAASGLPSIRHALLYDLEPVCFELTDDIGGLWRYKAEDRTYKNVNVSSVMKSTVINTSKEMTAYSDFPPKPESANFMHNSVMLQYLRDYADYHDLRKYIKFNHKVLSIERNADYLETGKWKITYLNEKDIEHVEIFDGVLLASGHHSEPRWPEPFPGQQNFRGQILHSHDYFSHKGFEDKIVAVVGIGNSGGDLAVELSRISKQVYLVTRRGTWVCNRLMKGGYPADAAMVTRKGNFIRSLLPLNVINTGLEKFLSQTLNHEAYGLKPEHRVLSAHPTCNDELANRLANKTVKIKPNIREFTESGIIFEDGSEVSQVDCVIFATGYKFSFPLVEKGTLIPVTDNSVALYLNMFDPKLSEHNSLAIIGLVQPWGSIMPISEMQARLFFDALTGGTKLPQKVEMSKLLEDQLAVVQSRYVKSPRHTIQVDYGVYMDDVANILQCKPNVLKLAFTDPILAWSIWTGPATAYTYRIFGPKPWQGARKAILETNDRIFAGMAPDGKYVKKACQSGRCYFKLFATILLVAVLVGIFTDKVTFLDRFFGN